MIYAKCIRGQQIALNKEDFIKRQDEENHVYCVGETTICKNNIDNLYCVPLNYIYDCLKYGDYIAIIDVEDTADYPSFSTYTKAMRADTQQKVLKIFCADSKEAVDFVFDNVKETQYINHGYMHTLSDETRDYFKDRLSNGNATV